jgi:hypothetical protein
VAGLIPTMLADQPVSLLGIAGGSPPRGAHPFSLIQTVHDAQ